VKKFYPYLVLAGLILSIVVYSLSALAYTHNTFVSKDTFEQLCIRLDSIDQKLGTIIAELIRRKK